MIHGQEQLNYMNGVGSFLNIHTLGWGAKWSPKPKDKVRLLECVPMLYIYGYNYMQKHTYMGIWV